MMMVRWYETGGAVGSSWKGGLSLRAVRKKSGRVDRGRSLGLFFRVWQLACIASFSFSGCQRNTVNCCKLKLIQGFLEFCSGTKDKVCRIITPSLMCKFESPCREIMELCMRVNPIQ